MNVHFMVFALEIASLNKTSESSFSYKNISFFGYLILRKFPQKLVFTEFKRVKTTVRAFTFYFIKMLIAYYLLTLKTT